MSFAAGDELEVVLAVEEAVVPHSTAGIQLTLAGATLETRLVGGLVTVLRHFNLIHSFAANAALGR